LPPLSPWLLGSPHPSAAALSSARPRSAHPPPQAQREHQLLQDSRILRRISSATDPAAISSPRPPRLYRSTFSGPSLGATDSHQASRHPFPTGVDTRRTLPIRKMFIRLDLSCSSCRQPRLLDGAYQCTLTAGSLDEACGQLLCNSCSRAHS
jgi:hypothetical protein